MKHWVDTYPHVVHATTILKENKIKLWQVGQGKLSDKYQVDPLVTNRPDYSYEEKTWTVNNSEEHEAVFQTLAPEWFKQWQLVDDFQGSSPHIHNDF